MNENETLEEFIEKKIAACAERESGAAARRDEFVLAWKPLRVAIRALFDRAGNYLRTKGFLARAENGNGTAVTLCLSREREVDGYCMTFDGDANRGFVVRTRPGVDEELFNVAELTPKKYEEELRDFIASFLER